MCAPVRPRQLPISLYYRSPLISCYDFFPLIAFGSLSTHPCLSFQKVSTPPPLLPPPPLIPPWSRAPSYVLVSAVEMTRSFTVDRCLTEEAVVAKLRAHGYLRCFIHGSVLHDPTGERTQCTARTLQGGVAPLVGDCRLPSAALPLY